MKKIVMIASVTYSNSDGISKKIISQAKALSSISKECHLFCLGEDCIYKIVLKFGEQFKIEKCRNSDFNISSNSSFDYIMQTKQLLEISLKYLDVSEFELVYIRHMVPNNMLLKLLSTLKKAKIKIIYEIPTYPYYYEQYNVSKNKLKAIVKIVLETVYWPLIYSRIDTLCTVTCNSKAKKFSKMRNIHNGVDSLNALKNVDGLKNLSLPEFEIIGVGTIYSYHGYDRIIKSLAECNGVLKNGKKIIFHIVGSSNEIEKLKQLTANLNLKDNVVFHGKQFGDSLDHVFDHCLLGVGTLALSIRKADIDTAIKNIEYLCRNLPVLTSGFIFDIDEKSGLCKIVKENKNIDFNELYSFSKKFYDIDKFKEIKDLITTFEWKNIMRNVVETIE